MKSTVAILILLLYVSGLFKPIYPYLEYAINKDYITKVLCINKDKPKMQCEGKCHLKKELIKAAEEQSDSKSNTPPRTNSNDNIYPHFIHSVYLALISSSTAIRYSFIAENPKQAFFDTPTPPPKFV